MRGLAGGGGDHAAGHGVLGGPGLGAERREVPAVAGRAGLWAGRPISALLEHGHQPQQAHGRKRSGTKGVHPPQPRPPPGPGVLPPHAAPPVRGRLTGHKAQHEVAHLEEHPLPGH